MLRQYVYKPPSPSDLTGHGCNVCQVRRVNVSNPSGPPEASQKQASAQLHGEYAAVVFWTDAAHVNLHRAPRADRKSGTETTENPAGFQNKTSCAVRRETI